MSSGDWSGGSGLEDGGSSTSGSGKAPSGSGKSIQALSQETAASLRKAQVITKISDIVRELVENSLDAGASSIQVVLMKHGVDKIEVRDNGHGIVAEDVQFAFKGGHTSKLEDLQNLSCGKWFGFRGEALNAMCASGTVTVVTKTADDPKATHYTLDRLGCIISEKHVARNVGTTVTVERLFSQIPVRRQWHLSSTNAANELKQMETYLKGVAIAHPKCHISLYHDNHLAWSKATVQTVEQALIAVLGHSIGRKLEKVGPADVKVDDDDVSRSVVLYLPTKPVDMRTMSFTSNKMAMIFCNKKRVHIREFEKLIHRYVTAVVEKPQPADRRRYPVSVVLITVPPREADFNRDIDKSKVHLVHKVALYSAIEEGLMKFYGIDLNAISNVEGQENGETGETSAQETERGGANGRNENEDVCQSACDTGLNKRNRTASVTTLPDVAPCTVTNGGRTGIIAEFLQEIPSTSAAFTKSPAKSTSSEPTAVEFPASKPIVNTCQDAMSRPQETTNGPTHNGLSCGPSIISNFEITLESQLTPEPPEELLGKDLEPIVEPTPPVVQTDRFQNWLEGRMLDKNGEIIQNVEIVNQVKDKSKEKNYDEFRKALFTGTPARSGSTKPHLNTPSDGCQSSYKRLRTDTPTVQSMAPPPTPTQDYRFRTPSGIIAPPHRQMTLDSLPKWSASKSIVSQAVPTSLVGVRLPMATSSYEKLEISLPSNRNQNESFPSTSPGPMQLAERIQMSTRRTFVLDKGAQQPCQEFSQDVFPAHWSPIQPYLEYGQISLQPKINGSLAVASNKDPLYIAQTEDAIGIFSPVNMVKYFLPEVSPSSADSFTFSETDVSDLFSRFLSCKDTHPSSSKVFHVLRTLDDLASVYNSMSHSPRY